MKWLPFKGNKPNPSSLYLVVHEHSRKFVLATYLERGKYFVDLEFFMPLLVTHFTEVCNFPERNIETKFTAKKPRSKKKDRVNYEVRAIGSSGKKRGRKPKVKRKSESGYILD